MEDVDIETVTQPQALYVINLARRSERVRGSEGRKPTRKTLSPNKCKVDDEAQGRTARDTARLRACPLEPGSDECYKVRRTGHTLCSAGVLSDVALLPSNSD